MHKEMSKLRLNSIYHKDIIHSEIIYKLKAIPIKIPRGFFMELDKVILKFMERGKNSRKEYSTKH
jgi:hypothetical protein